MVHTVRPQMARETGTGLEDKRCLLVVWKSHDTPDGGCLTEGLIIALEDGKTIDEQINDSIAQVKSIGVVTTDNEIRQMYRIAIGTIFLAISKDKRYVTSERIRVKNNGLCFCGSGKKYKQCHGRRNEEYTGLGVGKNISLPRPGTRETREVIEGQGKALQFSHLRSGHMRWQWYKNDEGDKERKLVFIHPLIVRPDLPMKPHTTPREIKRPPESRFNPIPYFPYEDYGDYQDDYDDYVDYESSLEDSHYLTGLACYSCGVEIEDCEYCDMECCECQPCECCDID